MRHVITLSVQSTFQILRRFGAQWLECQPLGGLPWVVHAFGLRFPSGAASSGGGASASESSGLALLLDAIGASGLRLASLRQVHSADVYVVSADDTALKYRLAGSRVSVRQNGESLAGDALLTAQAGIVLSVRTADCMPILLADTKARCIGAVHAGWRGTLARVVERAAAEMCREFAADPRDLLAAVGPCIHACCYEVGQDVREAFSHRLPDAERYFIPAPPRPGQTPRYYLDLVAAAVDQLRAAGLRQENVHLADLCTACRTDLFFSHRKEGPTGRMTTLIGLRATGLEAEAKRPMRE